MEHEDNNTQFGNNYLRGNLDEFSLQHNQQNLVENLQNASGFGAGGMVGVVEDIVGGGVSIGGKFDKEEHDEEEWKYVQEVQQSEKQQHHQQKMLKVGEGVGDGVGGLVVDYDVDYEGGDENVLLPTAEYEYEEESAIIKNDGDFSTTSNTTSTTVGEEENSAAVEEEEEEFKQLKAMHGDDDVVASLWSQAEKEVAIDLLGKENNLPETVEEKSSLATGENCENLQQQQQQYLDEQHETQAEKIHDNMFSSSSSPLFAAVSNISAKEEEEKEQKHEAEKENADPAVAAKAAVMDPLEDIDYAAVCHTEPQSLRPSELDLEMHSNLNPDAKEFVPVYSNPTSPISPEKPNDFLNFVGSTEEKPIQTNASPVLDFGVGDKNETDNDFGNSDKENENDVDDNLLGDVVGEPALSSSSVSPHPNAVPRHMIGTTAVVDDVVAQSPRKGRGLDMDEISLPAVNDFELEANERPHEIEQEDVVVAGDGDDRNEADKDATFKQMENGESMHRGAGDAGVDFEGAEDHLEISTSKDYTDFKHPLDHGPETSVDLDMDSHDVMKQSFYIENSAVDTMDTPEEEERGLKDAHEIAQNQPIEELLNTVQPIPTDSESINNSFDDLLDIPSKEMLNVEEKEVISQSPSTEEIQLQFQNELNASSKDVSSIPIDMDTVGHMQDSFYMEHTHNQNSMEMETETEIVTETSHETFVLPVAADPAHADELVSLPTLQEAVAPSPVPADEIVSLPTLQKPYHTESITPHETDESIKENYEFLTERAQPEAAATPIPAELQFTDFPEEKEAKELVTPSSPHSTEEKHLMEDTKEHINVDNSLNELEQKMDDLLLEHDSSLQKVDEVAQVATPIDEKEIASFVQESEITQPQRHEELLFAAEPLQASSSSPLLEQEHHNHHHDVEEDISASLVETQSELNVNQMQEVEDLLSSQVQEVVPPTENISEIAPEPSIKKDENPAIVHIDDSTNVDDETSAIVHVEASAIVDDATPTLDADAPSVPIIETLISAAEAPILQTEATVSMPEDEVAVVTKEVAAAAIAATAAVAATAATVAAVAAATSEKKSTEPIKKKTSTGKGSTTTTAAKSKLNTSGDAKKSTDTKKPTTIANKTSTLSATARPRTAPATSATKTMAAGSADKKTTTTTTTTTARPASHTTTARKPLTNNVTATKSVAKTSTARPATLGTSSSSSKTAAPGTTAARNGVAPKAPAPRPATATLASRKPMTTTTSAVPTQPTAAKSRPSPGGAATKPNTLNIAGKPKAALSPRATLTSQLRKTAGPTGTTAATAKSPIKTATSSTTNGSGKSPAVASSSTANRTKTTTTATTNTTKTFTARPAPKITSTLTTTSTLNTTTRRATTGSATKTSSNPIQRKSSPSKPTSTALGGKMSPTKTNATFKNKTKEFSTPKTAGKTTGGTTEVQAVLKVKQLVPAVDLEEQPKINGASCIAAGEPLVHTENGGENGGTHSVHYTHEENGSIEQGEMALMDGTAA